MCVLVAQSCPPLCNPMDRSPPGPSVHGILQARTLEWVAISFSKRNYRKKVKSLSHIRLFVTPWTVAYQAPPSMEFSRQEYWSGLPSPSPQLQGINHNCSTSIPFYLIPSFLPAYINSHLYNNHARQILPFPF